MEEKFDKRRTRKVRKRSILPTKNRVVQSCETIASEREREKGKKREREREIGLYDARRTFRRSGILIRLAGDCRGKIAINEKSRPLRA